MQKIDNEVWKDIPGYDGYQVSDLGNVRSLNYRHTGEVKVLRPGLLKNGYLHVTLCKNGKRKDFYVHRIVWTSFKGAIPKGMVINHLNEIKTDNRLSNLEICTVTENNNYGTRKERAGKAISKALKGRKLSEETKAKMSLVRKGRKRQPLSEEHKAKISASRKGQPSPNKGKKLKPLSEVHKAKLKGRTPWNKGQKNQFRHTKETKSKISATLKTRRERERSGKNNL